MSNTQTAIPGPWPTWAYSLFSVSPIHDEVSERIRSGSRANITIGQAWQACMCFAVLAQTVADPAQASAGIKCKVMRGASCHPILTEYIKEYGDAQRLQDVDSRPDMSTGLVPQGYRAMAGPIPKDKRKDGLRPLRLSGMYCTCCGAAVPCSQYWNSLGRWEEEPPPARRAHPHLTRLPPSRS